MSIKFSVACRIEMEGEREVEASGEKGEEAIAAAVKKVEDSLATVAKKENLTVHVSDIGLKVVPGQNVAKEKKADA